MTKTRIDITDEINATKLKYSFPSEIDYLNTIIQFPNYSERGWHDLSEGNLKKGYFADGGNEENGIRTNTNFVFVASFLASNTMEKGKDVNLSDLMLNRAQNCINYLIDGHITGRGHCANGGKWGDQWQSAWWTNKLVHGARLIWDKLSKQQQDGVDRVLEFEANRHLARIVPSGSFIDTKAEENAWDAEILATACQFLPSHSNVKKWQEKFVEFCFNTLSLPQDRLSEKKIDGIAIADAVYTSNLHSDYTIENHGSSHFCYIASPLLSITWSYYTFLYNENLPPDATFHNVKPFWEFAKSTFLDERFAYIGGKDWARYTYGLYFIVPALVMLQTKFSDTQARLIESMRVRALVDEHSINNDGSFFGNRVTKNIFHGQNAKYETDCYVAFTLAFLLHKKLGTDKRSSSIEALRRSQKKQHISPESHLYFANFDNYFASFSWRTLQKDWPIVLFSPRGCDDMLEWCSNNLVGKVRFLGEAVALGIKAAKMEDDNQTVTVHGMLLYRRKKQDLFEHHIHIQFTPEHTVIESKAVVKNNFLVIYCQPISLNIANDWRNNFERNIYYNSSKLQLKFNPNHKSFIEKIPLRPLKSIVRKVIKVLGWNQRIHNISSNWINIDNKLGLVRLDSDGCNTHKNLYILQPKERNTPANCLHYFTLAGGSFKPFPFFADKGTKLFHEKIILFAGDANKTQALARSDNIIEKFSRLNL